MTTRIATMVFIFFLHAIQSVPAQAEPVPEAAKRPNVLLIMADDVGCDALGCYGGESYDTPALDELARDGMRFRHCYSMPVCHPTRVCLLTGRYPFRLKNPRWGSFPKSAERQTVAHVMKDAGYATAIAGKWQLALLGRDPEHPHRLGFDDYCLFGWHEGPRYFDPMLWQNGKLREDTKGRYGPDLYCEFLIDFIERNKDRPFFAYYSMALCHDVTDDLAGPVPLGPAGRYETYHEMIESMDRHVGLMVAALDRLKLRENTLILFTTDNGTPKSYIHTAVNGKLVRKSFTSKVGGVEVRGGKGELTNAGTNVPLIANWTGTTRPGQVVEDLVDFSDFFATLADLAGAQLPHEADIDGQSFASRLQGGTKPIRDWAFAQHRGKHWVRGQRWKLYSDGTFFDVANDPLEKKPVLERQRESKAGPAYAKLREALAGLK